MSLLKLIHITTVLLSFTGFFIRGLWMLRDSPRLRQRWVKITPHVIDTTLLASAILLAIGIEQYPGTHDWLTAKVVGLIAYIVLGSIGLKRGRTNSIRTAAWIAALLVFVYIVAVALTRSPSLRLF